MYSSKTNKQPLKKMVQKRALLSTLRWLTSTVFFFLGITKAMMIYRYGLEPYETLAEVLSIPVWIKFYGLLAVVIELMVAVSLWVKQVFTISLLTGIILTGLGIYVSVYSLILKIKSDCGCGLFGDNEYSLLAQKVVILLTLLILLRNKIVLFNDHHERLLNKE